MNLPQKLVILLLGAAFALSAAVPEYLVVGKSPGKLEKKAVEELKLFYKKIYKKELKTISEKAAAGKSVIFLGDTAFSRKNGIDRSKAGKEEWILKTRGKNLIITGGLPAGTLYGVYELLERLGVIFASFDETAIPKNKPDFPKFNEKRQPALKGRLIFDGIPWSHLQRSKAAPKIVEDYRMWILRSRINGEQVAWLKAHYKGDLYNLTTYPYHNLSCYVDPAKYGKTHPEYFTMDPTGKRVPPVRRYYGSSLCMTNPDVKRITLESLRGFIKRDRKQLPKEEWPVVYDISELDATTYICRCPECKKVIASDGSENGLLLQYINHVAREIRKEYPEIIIRTSNRGRLPGKMRPEKNVMIRLGHEFAKLNPFIPFKLEDYPEYAKQFNIWKKQLNQIMMWDYWNLGGDTYFAPPRVETVIDTIQPDLKFFLRNKVNCMFYESSYDTASPQNFMMANFYVANHLMVKPDADVSKLIREFMTTYYGPAAPTAIKYFDLIRAGIKKYPQKATSAGAGMWRFVTPQFMLAFYKDFKKAADALPAGNRFGNRMRFELITPIWSMIANWQSFEQTFTSAGITRKDLIAECRRYVKAFIRRFPCNNPKILEQDFEKRFAMALLELPIPPKFKNVPAKDIRIVNSQFFRPVRYLGSSIVKDPDSWMGTALKSANTNQAYHGVDVRLPGKWGFRSTDFTFSTYPGDRKFSIRAVPADEKYHWYRIPGSVELHEKTTFWGNGWAIQGRANHWYMLTNGAREDNSWDQIWFSAKFTGPAYVPGSKKENAIYLDMLLIVRNTEEEQFLPVPEYSPEKAAGYAKEWIIRKGIQIDKNNITFTDNKKKNHAVGPLAACGKNDVLILKLKARGAAGRVGFYIYNGKKAVKSKFFPAYDTGYIEEYILPVADLKVPNVTGYRVVLLPVMGKGTVKYQDISVVRAKDLNLPQSK